MSYRGIRISLKNPYQGFLILFAQYIPKNSPTFKNRSDEKVLASLKTHCLYNKIGCYPSILRIAKQTGLSRRTVGRALQRLKKEEVIKIKYRRRRKNGQSSSSSNFYRLNLKKILPDGFKITYDILSDTEKVFAYRFIWLILQKLRYLVKYKIRLCRPYKSQNYGFVAIPRRSGCAINLETGQKGPLGSSNFSSNLSFPFFKSVLSLSQQPSKISYNEKGSPPLPHPEQDISLNYENRNKEVLGTPREASVSVSLGKLRQIGVKDVSKATMERLTSQYGTNRIKKSLEMTEWWSKNKELTHLGGYFIQSVKNNYETKEIKVVEIEENERKKLNEGIESRRKKRLEWEKEKEYAAQIKKKIDEMKPFERQGLTKEAEIEFLQRGRPIPEDSIGLELYEIEKRCFINSFLIKEVIKREIIK